MEKEEKQKFQEPSVKIFNQDMGSLGREEKGNCCKKDCCNHSHNHHDKPVRVSIFGLLVLFLGVLFLLDNFGYVTTDAWRMISKLWPVILILVGIKIFFSKK